MKARLRDMVPGRTRSSRGVDLVAIGGSVFMFDHYMKHEWRDLTTRSNYQLAEIGRCTPERMTWVLRRRFPKADPYLTSDWCLFVHRAGRHQIIRKVPPTSTLRELSALILREAYAT